MLTVKFKLILKFNLYTVIQKRRRWSTKNVKLFADLFDMTLYEWQRHRCEKKIAPMTADQIRAIVAVSESIGISKQELLKYPRLLKESAKTVEQHYIQLKEGGFTDINAGVLANFRKCSRTKISFLKVYKLIPQHVNVAKSFVSHLNPKPNNFPVDDLTDEDVYGDVYHAILTRYLMWKFNTTKDDIEKFYRINSESQIKCFTFLCQNFSTAEELGLPPKKVFKYGFLLTVYPKYTQTVLTEMPVIAGCNIRDAMRRYPKLIGIAPKHYIEIYNILKNADIPDKTIQKNMNIFCVSSKSLRTRLEEILSIPELKVLLASPNMLKLIISHNEARSRLSFLQQAKLKCATTSILATATDTFNQYIREGKDINSPHEVISVVKYLLKTDSDLVEENLKRHRYYRHVPLLEIEQSYKVLKKLKFTNESIANVTQVLLYPSYKIQEAYNNIKTCSSLSRQKMSYKEKLNLILYFIEKEHHFTGNGIWSDDKQKS